MWAWPAHTWLHFCDSMDYLETRESQRVHMHCIAPNCWHKSMSVIKSLAPSYGGCSAHADLCFVAFLQHLHDLKRKAHRDKDTACHDGPSAVKHPKYMQCCQGKELATLLRSRLVSLWPCLHPNHLKNCAFGNFLSVKLGLKTLVRVIASVKCLRNRRSI